MFGQCAAAKQVVDRISHEGTARGVGLDRAGGVWRLMKERGVVRNSSRRGSLQDWSRVLTVDVLVEQGCGVAVGVREVR